MLIIPNIYESISLNSHIVNVLNGYIRLDANHHLFSLVNFAVDGCVKNKEYLLDKIFKILPPCS